MEARMSLNYRENYVTRIQTSLARCKYCASLDVVKFGIYKNIQRLYCKNCKRKFADNGALPGMRVPIDIIASALNSYYEGMSLNAVCRHLKLTHSYCPSDSTVYEWIAYFTQIAIDKAGEFKADTGDIWVADETVLKIGGRNMWFWDIIDDRTRFLLASHVSPARTTKDARTLMISALKRSRLRPSFIITDKLQAYLQGVKGIAVEHYQSRGFSADINTNLIERFHGTIKGRTKVMRGLKSKATGKRIMDGWLIHYNFFRPHQTLNNKTPGEIARIDFPFKNWKDVIGKGIKYN